MTTIKKMDIADVLRHGAEFWSIPTIEGIKVDKEQTIRLFVKAAQFINAERYAQWVKE